MGHGGAGRVSDAGCRRVRQQHQFGSVERRLIERGGGWLVKFWFGSDER
jgi:hypothetical protein